MFNPTTLLALLPLLLPAITAQSTGKTTRYWDCCKPSCAWPGKASVSAPVQICNKQNNPLTDANTKSACDGGDSVMCGDQTPMVISDSLAYGYGAAKLAGSNEAGWCCGCYELTFTTTEIAGKKMIIQVTNTGGDLGDNHFDLAIPGGGFGIFDACTAQYGTPATGWGERYGGVTSRAGCDAFPAALKAGCYWRFDWFKNADNPDVSFKKVTCPAALTSKTGCVRQGETPTGSSSVVPVVVAPSSSVPASSANPTTKSSAAPTTKSSAAPAATSAASSGGNAVQKYGQCGGQTYTGSKTCASGSTCKKSNDYYSQCL